MALMGENTTASGPVLLANQRTGHEKEVFRRWRFDAEQHEIGIADSYTRPTSSLVKSTEPWECQQSLSNVAVGWYSLVFCVSLDKLNIDLLESITFDVKLCDREHRDMKDTGAMTVVSEEVKKHIPRTGRTLLRLHRQANISDITKYLNPIITIKTTAASATCQSMELHYIELTTKSIQPSADAGETVHTLYGEDKPDQFIKVGDSSTYPVKICAYAVSDMGTYVATLYRIHKTAYLDIWNIHKQDDDSRTTPYAQQSFQLEDGHEFADLTYEVAISSTGLQAAVCSLDETGRVFLPFSIFSCWPVTPAEHSPGRPWTLYKPLISWTRFKGAFGYIAFRTIDSTIGPEDIETKNERFFKFDGVTFDVHKASGYWRRLFSIPTNIERTPKAMMAETPFYSIRRKLFAYTGSKGFVTIWDFETGRIVSKIFVPVDTKPVRASISRDGSLVAIAVKGVIRVHDVQSGIRLGSMNKDLNETNDFEMDFDQDYLTTLKSAAPTTECGSQPKTRSVVRLRDISIADTYEIQPKYRLQTPQAIGAPIFAFDQGAILNIIKRTCRSSTEKIPWHINCSAKVLIQIHEFRNNQLNLNFTATDGTEFKLTASDVATTLPSATMLLIEAKDASGTTIKTVKISIGAAHSSFQGFYLKGLSQLFILSGCYLQVWDLSATNESICELAYIWKLHPDEPPHAEDYNDDQHSEDYIYRTLMTATTCEGGMTAHITLSPTQRMRNGEILRMDVHRKKDDIVTLPISPKDTLAMTQEMRLVSGVQHLARVYAESDSSVQGSVLRYLMNCIRPSSKHPESSLVSLCRAWTPENGTCVKEIVSILLPLERVTWIPHMSSSKSKDPLAILLHKTRRWPAASRIVKIFTGYCTYHATRTSDPSFLAPVFASMSDLMELLPGYARGFLTEVSYMPTKQRSFILRNHIIAQPPKVFLKFWQSKKESLAEAKNPILQTHGAPAKCDHKNDEFHQELFIASFNMLWNFKEDPQFKTARMSGNTWWKMLYHLLTLKLRLRTHTYIECHNFTLEVFDNPAIAALVSYKWNTIGCMYWLFRFTFQLVFYGLVMAAALLQVFHDSLRRAQVMAVLITIIVFGAVFLWLELVQAVKTGKKYRTIYNQLDVLVYTVPVCTSIHQMVVLHKNDPSGYTKILSFAVLIVFLHALFELRVFKSVCKSVSIIQHTVVEIRAFFFIFAAGIIAFAVATLHLLRACPVLEGCKELTTKFSSDFMKALSTTYFFMGGRYNDVDNEFDSEAWEFHLMMVVYFFFTVIVMLNVLIALINVAFTKGDDRWRLVWIESRLRYIESAEELSYHIPGFRQLRDWFPTEIFYTTTLQKVKAYREKYHSKASMNEDHRVLEDWERDDYDDEDESQRAARTRKLWTSPGEEDNGSVVKDLKVQVMQLKEEVALQSKTQQEMHRLLKELTQNRA